MQPVPEPAATPHEKFFISNCHIYPTDSFSGLKVGTIFAVRKGILHTYVDLPPHVSKEATEVCVPIGNSEVSHAAVYKPPGQALSDADIELLNF
jgi:hypothetical protein